MWGIQVGDLNFGVGDPTFLFGEGSGEYFGQSLAATADGFIPFFDPFSGSYSPCDKNLQLSKDLGAFSRNTFIVAYGLKAVGPKGNLFGRGRLRGGKPGFLIKGIRDSDGGGTIKLVNSLLAPW